MLLSDTFVIGLLIYIPGFMLIYTSILFSTHSHISMFNPIDLNQQKSQQICDLFICTSLRNPCCTCGDGLLLMTTNMTWKYQCLCLFCSEKTNISLCGSFQLQDNHRGDSRPDVSSHQRQTLQSNQHLRQLKT